MVKRGYVYVPFGLDVVEPSCSDVCDSSFVESSWSVVCGSTVVELGCSSVVLGSSVVESGCSVLNSCVAVFVATKVIKGLESCFSKLLFTANFNISR